MSDKELETDLRRLLNNLADVMEDISDLLKDHGQKHPFRNIYHHGCEAKGYAKYIRTWMEVES